MSIAGFLPQLGFVTVYCARRCKATSFEEIIVDFRPEYLVVKMMFEAWRRALGAALLRDVEGPLIL